jgi:hypothetical protein
LHSTLGNEAVSAVVYKTVLKWYLYGQWVRRLNNNECSNDTMIPNFLRIFQPTIIIIIPLARIIK